MNILSTLAGAGGPPAQSGTFGLDVDGDGTFAAVTTNAGARDAVPLDQAAHSGDPAYRDIRIAYEMQAEAAGLDPATIAKGSAEDRQVLADLSQTLSRVGNQPLGQGQVASNMANLKAQAEATVSLRTANAETGLTASGIASAAAAPGAAVAADILPITRGAGQAAAITRQSPATAAAGVLGAATGAAIAVEAGRLNGGTAPASGQSVEQDRAGARAALDVNRDDILQCREIGGWTPDTGVDSRSANAQAYQAYVTGVSGMDFTVATPLTGQVRFDGCVDQAAGAKLLEAKADHGVLLSERASGWSGAQDSVAAQGIKQQDASTALDVKAEWHVQMRGDHVAISEVFKQREIMLPVLHTPMPLVE